MKHSVTIDIGPRQVMHIVLVFDNCIPSVAAWDILEKETGKRLDGHGDMMSAMKHQSFRGTACAKSIPMRGVGDVIAAATSAIGIQPCGKCKERQEALNKMLPFTSSDS